MNAATVKSADRTLQRAPRSTSRRRSAGSVSGNQINLAVKLPADLSECYYNGVATSPAQARGVYICYTGGRMIEEGVWSVARQSSDPP